MSNTHDDYSNLTSQYRSMQESTVYLGVHTDTVHSKTGNTRLGSVTILWGNDRIENQLESTQNPKTALDPVSLNFSGIIKVLELSPVNKPITIITINKAISNFFNKPARYKNAVIESPYFKRMELHVKRVKELINARYIKPKVMLADSESPNCIKARDIATSKVREYKEKLIQQQQQQQQQLPSLLIDQGIKNTSQNQGRPRQSQQYPDTNTTQKPIRASNSSRNNHVTGSSSLSSQNHRARLLDHQQPFGFRHASQQQTTSLSTQLYTGSRISSQKSPQQAIHQGYPQRPEFLRPTQPVSINEFKKPSIAARSSPSPLIQPPVNRLRKRKQDDSTGYLHLSQKSRRLLKKYKLLIDEESNNNNSMMDHTPTGYVEDEEVKEDNPMQQQETAANNDAVIDDEEEDNEEFVDAAEEFNQDNQNNNNATHQSSYVPTWMKNVYSSFKKSFNR